MTEFKRCPTSIFALLVLASSILPFFAGRASAQANVSGSASAPTNLRVEYLVEPLGIEDQNPRFSWELVDPRRGALQTFWQIVVDEDAAVVAEGKGSTWDSGQIAGGETNQITYRGAALRSGKRYSWRVRSWDHTGTPTAWSSTATFGMGFLSPRDWKANWIGENDPTEVPGGAIGFHSAWTKNADDFRYIQFDFGVETIFNEVRIHPAHPAGKTDAKLGHLFPLQFRLYVDNSASFDKTFAKCYDHQWGDVRETEDMPIVAALTRYKMRYLRLVVSKAAKVEGSGFAFALGEIEILDAGNNIASKAKITVSDSLDEAGWSTSALIDEVLVPGGPPPLVKRVPTLLLRKQFRIEAPVVRATLRTSALGLYRALLNAEPVSDDRLTPGWSDYTTHVRYQTYDVTSLLGQGDNTFAAELADGWFAGRIGLASIVPNGPTHGLYGKRPRFLAQLEIATADGKTQTIATDGSWKCSNAGPRRTADLLDGETYDTRSQILGWDRSGLDEAGWPAVAVFDYKAIGLTAQRDPPIRAVEQLAPVSVKEAGKGIFVYDFGQVLSGVVRLKLNLPSGQAAVLQYGEALNPNGQVYRSNLRTARQQDVVTGRGAELETYESFFTVHGFRYLQVLGPQEALPLADVTALSLHTDARTASNFECSNELLNKLWSNITWTQRANFVGLPTDCPQRDERLGWLGDISAYGRTAMYQMDVASFLGQWSREVRGAQTADGRFPDFAPHPYKPEERYSGAPGWSDAGVSLPFDLYLNYHDQRLAKAALPSIHKWLAFVEAKNPSLVWREARGNDYGDWLNGDTWKFKDAPKGNEMPKDAFATAFFARSADRAARLAFATGDIAGAQRFDELSTRVRAAFRAAFVDEKGVITGDTQAGYALAVAFDLLGSTEARRAAADRLAARIRAQGCLTTGIHSTNNALLALSENGHHDLAVDLMTRATLPSFGYAIENGATTIWERMDGYTKEAGFQDPAMNSFCHYAFGSVGEWMMRELAGIELDESAYVSKGSVTLNPVVNGETKSSAEGPQAWQHFRLVPHIGSGLTHVRASHDSIAGRIESAWKVEGGTLTYECLVPPGSHASLRLPVGDPGSVREGGKSLADAGVIGFVVADGVASCELPSGRYSFTCKQR